jgi:aminopeptidase N
VTDSRERCGGHGLVDSGRRDFATPGAKPQWAPDRLADIRHILLELTVVPEKAQLRGTVTHHLTPIAEPLSRIPFNLEELVVDAVKVAGRETRFHHEGGVLEVFLSPALLPDREVPISITYHGSPRTGLNFTAPDKAYPNRPYTAWSQGQDQYSRYWWPSHDFPNQRSTTEMVVTAPGKYEVISNGRLVSVSKNRDMRIWHWLQEIPHVAYLVSLVVGEFDHWSEEVDGIPLDYYVPVGRRKDGERSFAHTADMVRCLGGFAGEPYPYAKYAQVVVPDFTWGGMENTSATTLTDFVLQDERSQPDYDLDTLLAHELAHQWFGDLVTCREWAHAWLNEGFASYCEYVWEEWYLGEDEAQLLRFNDSNAYFAEDARYRRPIVWRVYTEPVELFDVHLYEKAAWVLWMLRNVVGDDVFKRAIQTYVVRYRNGLVTTPDLVRVFEDVSGKTLGWFFDEWVYGAGHPEFEVSFSWDEDAGAARIAVKQTQKIEGDTHLFRMPIRVAFGQPGRKQPVMETIDVGARGEAEDGFSVSLTRRPTWVRFDHENRVLKTLKFERPEELILVQFREDEVSGRIEAAQALGRKSTPAGVAALAEAVRKDPFWGVQAAAARALGETRAPAARTALLETLEHPESRVRGAAARALGAWRGDDEVGRALAAVMQKDRSYYAIAGAAASLGSIRARNAPAELKKALQRDSQREVIRISALAGLAALEDERQLPVILEMSKPGHHQRVRGAALVRAADLAAGLAPEQRRPVREAAEEALRDPLYFVRRGAVDALRRLGDAGAVGALRATIERDVEGAVRHEARLAAEELIAGRSREEALKNLREEVESLRQSSQEMKARLEKLEPARTPTVKPSGKPAAARNRPPVAPKANAKRPDSSGTPRAALKQARPAAMTKSSAGTRRPATAVSAGSAGKTAGKTNKRK